MSMTTIKLFGGDLGEEIMMVRCDLAKMDASIEADYCNDEGWMPTQYQSPDARHTAIGLAEIGKLVCASTVEIAIEQFKCDWEVV